MTKEQWQKIGSIVLGAVLVVLAVLGWVIDPTTVVVEWPSPLERPVEQPVEEGVEALAVERGGLLCATESGNCVESWNGSDIVMYSDAGSTQVYAIDGATGNVTAGGVFDLNGQKMDIDADADTSVTADTDDQVDWEIGAADVMTWKDFTATALTNTTEYMVEIYDTTGIGQSGTNAQAALNIDLGIGNSTAGTNSIYGILIDAISQDAQNTETAIAIASGWDRGLDMDGNSIYLDDDQDSYFSELADDSIGFTPGAATGSFEVRTGNLQVGDGSPGETHNGEDLYVEGISEFDGAAYFDGAVDFDAGLVGAEDVENTMLPTVLSTAITYTASAGGSGTVATITDGEIWFVHAVFVRTTTNFDCTGDDATLTIGDGNDADGFIVAADANLQASFTEATGFAAGWYGIENGSAGAYTTDDGGPFVYAPSGADETIDWVVDESSGESLTAGAATIYVVYTRIQ